MWNKPLNFRSFKNDLDHHQFLQSSFFTVQSPRKEKARHWLNLIFIFLLDQLVQFDEYTDPCPLSFVSQSAEFHHALQQLDGSFISLSIWRSVFTMLHLPSMLTYGILSFSMAFLNKALFEVADFRSSLFVILFQLIFVVLSFHLFSYCSLLSVPTISRNDLSKFLIPSIFFCLSTVLSLQALMHLNVAVYVVIKVGKKSVWANFIDERKNFLLALYTRVNVCSSSDRPEKTDVGSENRFLCFCHHHWCCDYLNQWSFLSSGIVHHRFTQRHFSISLSSHCSTLQWTKIFGRCFIHQQFNLIANDLRRFNSLYQWNRRSAIVLGLSNLRLLDLFPQLNIRWRSTEWCNILVYDQ